jgi:hypothetical protein
VSYAWIVLQREEVGGEPGRIDCPAATLATLFAGWGSKGIHQAGRDGDALDPQRLQAQRRRPATWTDQLGALLEGLRDANRLRGHAGAQPVGQPVDLGTGLLGGVVAKLAPNFWAVTPSGVGSIATIAEGEYSGVPGSRPARPSRLHHPQRRGLRCPGP